MPDQALGHLKVLELCKLVAGPYCTKLLADLGARVIKIEPPGRGDEARFRGPFLNDIPDPELSGLFLHLNTNKLGITLDVNSETGRRIFRELIGQVDVFVQDYPPALAEQMGLIYEVLEKVQPRLVMASITPFGLTGPYRDYKAYELNSFHAGGEGYLLPLHSGEPYREPVKAGGIVGDCACGLVSALAILAAAFVAASTGTGQHIDLSKQDILMSLVQNHVCTYGNIGEVHSRLRTGFLLVLPMECQDGYVMMTIVTTREWQSLVEAMGNPEWAQQDKFLTWAGRHLYANEINPKVSEWVRRFKKDELFHLLQAKGVAAVPVNTAADLAQSQHHYQERGFFTEIEHPVAGLLRYPTAAYQFTRTPWSAARPAPLLGEHNQVVYCEQLGYSHEDLARLAEAGII